jgi:hypothetical protein
MSRTLALALLTALTLLTSALVAPPSVAATGASADVHGDDVNDRYSGTGGLILPASVDERTRKEVASCAGCAWRLTSPCASTTLGTPFDSPCRSVVRGCPGGQLLRSWFRPAGSDWRETGLICLVQKDPVTVTGVAREIRGAAVRAVPRQRAAAHPPAGILVQLPVIFDSGQPSGPLTLAMPDIAGMGVVVVAHPTWTWSFGDGGSLTTTASGGSYPTMDVTHTYRFAGEFSVECQTRWSALFTVDGLGPFAIPEQIHQEVELLVSVGEGRALLSPPGMAE